MAKIYKYLTYVMRGLVAMFNLFLRVIISGLKLINFFFITTRVFTRFLR